MPLIIILVECGIELIPKQIRNHSAIKRNFSPKIYSSQLLDTALHHSAMTKLKNSEKRGRPDITHLCLLNALGSPLNKTRNLKIFFHTINNKIFEVNPEVRIARNFNRFKGLMAKLLINGTIEIEFSKLISSFNGGLKELINTFEFPEIFLFSTKGKLMTNYQDLFSEDLAKNYIAIIGGFQKSNFSKEILSLSNNVISISQYRLDAWVVINKIISYYELNYDIQ
ncbi:MAG: 16S rRNA methyltransferase [Promethearchaeota archaeon]